MIHHIRDRRRGAGGKRDAAVEAAIGKPGTDHRAPGAVQVEPQELGRRCRAHRVTHVKEAVRPVHGDGGGLGKIPHIARQRCQPGAVIIHTPDAIRGARAATDAHVDFPRHAIHRSSVDGGTRRTRRQRRPRLHHRPPGAVEIVAQQARAGVVSKSIRDVKMPAQRVYREADGVLKMSRIRRERRLPGAVVIDPHQPVTRARSRGRGEINLLVHRVQSQRTRQADMGDGVDQRPPRAIQIVAQDALPAGAVRHEDEAQRVVNRDALRLGEVGRIIRQRRLVRAIRIHTDQRVRRGGGGTGDDINLDRAGRLRQTRRAKRKPGKCQRKEAGESGNKECFHKIEQLEVQDFTLLALWENALGGDAPVHAEIGITDGHWLAAARRAASDAHRGRIRGQMRAVCGAIGIHDRTSACLVRRRRHQPDGRVAERRRGSRKRSRGGDAVGVRGHLARSERDGLGAALVPHRDIRQPLPLADADRRTTAKVRQAEGGLSVATVSRPEQGEKGLVLVDWQEAAVADRPALRSEVKAEDAELSDEWFHNI